MKILQINTVYNEGSTGKIVKDIQTVCKEQNMESLAAYRCNNTFVSEDTIEISSKFDSRFHGFLARITMFKGCFSIIKTKSFLKKIEAFSPDVIHLHNLHGSYINLPLLFKYIKRKNIPVIWTLHDCWAFTAICSHFTIANCNKWKTGCTNCVQRKKISDSLIDFTNVVWKLKKKWFTSVSDITIVTPSRWLENLTKQSFLGKYPTKTLYNGIDLTVFNPTDSNFRETYGIKGKNIILGVAYGWGYGKGLDVFCELSHKLPDDYTIVLVGTNETIDKQLPSNIISIHRTENQKELAEIYTAANVFVNPTREEVLGLVNIEALACGTPVITFDVCGSPECIDYTCGSVVKVNDIDTLEQEIIRICKTQPFSEKGCVDRAKKFDKKNMLDGYIELYRSKGCI